MFLKLPSFLIKGLLFSIFLLFLASTGPFPSQAGLYDQLLELQRQIKQYEGTIKQLQGKEKSLKNEIAYYDNQIYLTQLEIQAKETEIELLNGDIGNLSTRLERIGSFLEFQERIFVVRARSAYISDQLSSFDIVLGAESLEGAIRRIRYLRVLEEQDRTALEEMKETRTSFNGQKTVLEGKKADVERLKADVEAKKASLERQRADRAYLLAVTRNSEEQYQRLLEQQRIEFAAIQAALAAQGNPIGPVSRGQVVGWEGNTGCVCSDEYGCNPQPWPYGSHTHFVVAINGVLVDPLPYLQNGTLAWPEDMSSAQVTQYYSSSSHRAIDIAYPRSFSQYVRPIFAPESGNAYRGQDGVYCSWGNSGGRAYWVKVIHNNGLVTISYHVQPPQ